MNYYLSVLNALGKYFQTENWKKLFMEGGCYWLADILHRGITGSFLMINRMQEHCAIYFANGLYDVSGKISNKFFQVASERDISFMKKNYIPHFDVRSAEQYLEDCALL